MAERKSMIHVRGGFSEAHGMGSCVTQMQLDDLDDRTRNILFNIISVSLYRYFNRDKFYDRYGSPLYNQENQLCQLIFTYVLGIRFNASLHYDMHNLIPYIEKIISNAPYNEVFDLLEKLYTYHYHDIQQKEPIDQIINSVFEQEYVGYRFVDGRIVPITDENEIKSIEDACSGEFEGPRTHIKKAVGFIADREHKDYKNCIKESISAVESICSIIVGNDKATLPDALKILKKNNLKIHPVLEVALIKLYAYTSDENGIRHAEGLFENDVTFEEAEFMLVSCSAFVNYLIANYGKVGGTHA